MKPTPRMRRRRRRRGGDDGQRRDEVGDAGHVDVDAVQRHLRIALDRQPAAPVADGAAHPGEQVDERGVALEAVAVQAADLDPATGDGGHRQRVAGRRGVRLDVEHGAGGSGPRARRCASSPTSTPATPNAAITSAVIDRYGADTSGVVGRSRRPPSSSGPISISAVRNWLDTSPGNVDAAATAERAAHRHRQVPAVGRRRRRRARSRASCSGPIGRRRSGGAAVDGHRAVGERGDGGDEPRRGPGEPGVEADRARTAAGRRSR